MGSSRERGFSVTPERLAFIEQKMREMGIESREALAKAANLSLDVIHKKLFSGKNVDRSTVEAITKTLKIHPTELVEPDRWYRRSKTAKSQASTNIDWQYVCRTMLNRQKKLSTNEVIASEAMQFDLLDDEIFISLALVERKEPDRLSQNVHPARPLEQYEEKPPIEYEKFREQILRQGKSDRIAIVGEPGAGKTTLLQHIAFWILDKELGLPIWISLGDLIKNGDLQRLKDYLTQVWLDDAVLNVTQDVKSDFLKQLNEQRVWLLLDGADEIVASSGIALREINNQLRGWLSQSCIILTCRINVWEVDINALRDFQTYRTKEFHYPTQVERFIESGFRKSNQQSGERLKTELASTERTRLQQLVRNPLRLMMLCTTWHEQESLPATKAELYKRFVSEFYKWNRSKWKKKDLNYAFFPNTVAKQEKLNKALGRLACRALDEESSPFRLPHNSVSDELGDPDEDGSDFWLALNLGWLQVARDSDKPPEKVYTFFHPTFQEYFAACAINDWRKDFLNHVLDNPKQGTYRIFESQWKEVILLWLGRNEGVEKKQKEEFIQALVKFKDGCMELFYRYQAYFLAAAGIAEFKDFSDCNTSNHIVNEIVKWSFGLIYQVEFPYPHTQESKLHKFVENAAKSILSETNHKLVITNLSNLLDEEGRSEKTIFEVASLLLKLSPGHCKALSKMKYLIQNSQNTEIFKWASLKFLESTPDESDPIFDRAYKILLEPIGGAITREAWESNWENCGNDGLSRLLSIAREAYNNQNKQENQTKKIIFSDCPLKGTTIQDQIQELIEILETGINSELHFIHIHHLIYIGHRNKDAIQKLIEIVKAPKNKDFYYAAIEGLGIIGIGSLEAFNCLLEVINTGRVPLLAIWSMKNILDGDLFDLAVRKLKHQFLLYYYYEIIWHCAQNMSYPDFYQAWALDDHSVEE